jgi:hypothetical protein
MPIVLGSEAINLWYAIEQFRLMSMATSEQCRYLGRRLETQEFQETALRNEATREQAVKKSLRLSMRDH